MMPQHWRDRLVGLRRLGMSYKEYLGSEHWKGVKRDYVKSGRLQGCLACGKRPFALHHITYARVGCEAPGDVMPLCKGCHRQVHAFVRRRKVPLDAICTIFRILFRWDARKIVSLVEYNASDYVAPPPVQVPPPALKEPARPEFRPSAIPLKKRQRMGWIVVGESDRLRINDEVWYGDAKRRIESIRLESDATQVALSGFPPTLRWVNSRGIVYRIIRREESIPACGMIPRNAVRGNPPPDAVKPIPLPKVQTPKPKGPGPAVQLGLNKPEIDRRWREQEALARLAAELSAGQKPIGSPLGHRVRSLPRN